MFAYVVRCECVIDWVVVTGLGSCVCRNKTECCVCVGRGVFGVCVVGLCGSVGEMWVAGVISTPNYFK